jgi:outer membrane protein OmpA-like peptidoglycan-associated protein
LPAADRRAYRRGQILGLTVAEFFLVLAFLLLLALALFAAKSLRDRSLIDSIVATLSQKGEDITAEELIRKIEAANEAKAHEKELEDQISKLEEKLKDSGPLGDTAEEIPPQDRKDFIELVRKLAEQARSAPEGVKAVKSLLDDKTMLEAVRRIAKDWTESNARLGDELRAEFDKDLARWNAEVDQGQLVVRFKNPDVLFKQGAAGLQPHFATILSEFCPRFLALLSHQGQNIAEIRIEGHTSSEWTESATPRGAYFSNMALSQARTRAVLEYCLSLGDLATIEPWARSKLVAVGMSSSRLETNPTTGEEDRERSRRVEFRVVTDAAARIGDIVQQVRVQGTAQAPSQ